MSLLSQGRDYELTIQTLTNITRLSARISILKSEKITQRMRASVETLELHLQNGEDIYSMFKGWS